MHRRHRRRKSASVDLNLAAMLDMAFRLLTFFILPFRPAPVEGQLGLHLPPPVALTKVKQEAESDSGTGASEQSDLETLDLQITSDDRGEVSLIKVGMRPLVRGRLSPPNLDSLNQQLKVTARQTDVAERKIGQLHKRFGRGPEIERGYELVGPNDERRDQSARGFGNGGLGCSLGHRGHFSSPVGSRAAKRCRRRKPW